MNKTQYLAHLHCQASSRPCEEAPDAAALSILSGAVAGSVLSHPQRESASQCAQSLHRPQPGQQSTQLSGQCSACTGHSRSPFTLFFRFIIRSLLKRCLFFFVFVFFLQAGSKDDLLPLCQYLLKSLESRQPETQVHKHTLPILSKMFSFSSDILNEGKLLSTAGGHDKVSHFCNNHLSCF